MSTRVDTEEIATTRSERVLAVVLALFLLVGTVWFYVQVPEWVDDALGDTSSLNAAESIENEKDEARWAAESARDDAQAALNLEREEYKVALQEGSGVAEARADYDEAKVEYNRRQAELKQANAEWDAASQKADEARAHQERASRSGSSAWLVAGIRLVFIAGWMVGAYQLLAWLRRRESRYVTLVYSGAIVGAVMALVFAVDYITDYIDPLDLGPFVLSAIGVVATVIAFRVLQRYLAARLPGRRVRKGECPFCGFPLREAGLADGPHCGGCGRDVVAPCSTCHAPRRVGSSFCARCGTA
ncbi:hypothetical protein GL325_03255 [Aeromicrobium sp. 636]|uniref:Zinc ribbon domain-containing protein n=1 Tax=Aeromicrobium senzhongii TaxID=2663859 RepID=A0A8I0ERZ2_9ACTN|nr:MULTISPECIES: hypothetical protein [Aeromicrobium]MBC9225331.1 hypothetical protein [Aeromicrobium senzhongii]MCQ3997441.1 hypothetical protein [Aeromicrobium sp. 636]